MKIFATLVCLLGMTACFAQQSPLIKKNDPLENAGTMPILKGHGEAVDMPTRNGRGEALPIPNRPSPLTAGEHTMMAMKNLESIQPQIQRFIQEHHKADSVNREKPTNPLPPKKK